MSCDKPPSPSSDPDASPSSRPGQTYNHLNFVVGRDPEGHWLAVETHGLGGGIFTSQDAAVHYAAFEACCRCEAIQVMPTAIQFMT